MPITPRRLVDAALTWPVTWPVTSQQQARRNAQASCFDLARARSERLEVEAFLDSLARTSGATGTAGTA